MARSKKNNVRWVEPFQLRQLLENCMKDDQPWPPDSNGVYVVSQKQWKVIPAKKAGILYVGSNTSQSPLFLTRVGSLIADMLGFFTDDHGHHSGGQWLWKHCKDNKVHPLDLYLGWVEGIPCCRCAEAEVYEVLAPLRCEKRPSACGKHVKALRVCLLAS